MKKLLIAFFLLGTISSTIVSCKKGENDPFLSLRSRKARLTGEWKVTGYETKETDSDGDSYSESLNGSIITVTDINNGGTPDVSTYVFTSSITFNKDYTFTQIQTYGDSKIERSGNWAFGLKSKEGDIKKKETVVLSVLKETYTNTSSTSINTDTSFDEYTIIYFIDQLKNKEIVLTDSYTSTEFLNGVTQYSGTYSFKTTLTK
jgi:hypothetical protein